MKELRPAVYSTEYHNALRHDDQMKRAGHTGYAYAPHVRSRLAVVRDILASHGIPFFEVDQQPPDLGAHTGKYTSLGDRRPHTEMMAKVRAAAPGMPIVPTVPLQNANLKKDRPLVLKRPEHDSKGLNKFLVEDRQQRQRLDAFRTDRPYIAERWAVQPFVPGPVRGVSSSFRVVATATGRIMASSLIYRPTPGTRLDVPFETRGRGSGAYRYNREGWEDQFADPQSPYFLNSRDVRSNAALGGRVVPLRVDGRFEGNPKAITRADRQIAEQHGLSRLETPHELLEWSSRIGALVGPEFALVMGNDFLQGADGRRSFLEENAYPGHETLRRSYQSFESMGTADIENHLLDTVASDLATLRRG